MELCSRSTSVRVALKRDNKGEHETPVEIKFVGEPILHMQFKQRFIFFRIQNKPYNGDGMKEAGYCDNTLDPFTWRGAMRLYDA